MPGQDALAPTYKLYFDKSVSVVPSVLVIGAFQLTSRTPAWTLPVHRSNASRPGPVLLNQRSEPTGQRGEAVEIKMASPSFGSAAVRREHLIPRFVSPAHAGFTFIGKGFPVGVAQKCSESPTSVASEV